MPEIDVPAHTASWGHAFPDIIVHCDNVVGSSGIEESVNRVGMHPLKQQTFDVIECKQTAAPARHKSAHHHHRCLLAAQP